MSAFDEQNNQHPDGQNENPSVENSFESANAVEENTNQNQSDTPENTNVCNCENCESCKNCEPSVEAAPDNSENLNKDENLEPCSCNSCGVAPEHSEFDEKAQTKRRKKGWIITFAVIALLAIVSFFSYDWFLLHFNPNMYLMRASMSTANRMAENLSEPIKSFFKSLENGTITLNIDTTELAQMDDSAPVNLEMRYSANKANEQTAFDLRALIDGVSVNLNFRQDNNQLSLSSPELTQGEAYGIEFDNFAEKFSNSVFAPDSQSDFSMPEDTYQAILSMAESKNLSPRFDFEDYKKNSYELMKNYLKDIHPEISKQKVDINDRSVNANVIKYTFSGEQASDFMNLGFDMLEQLGFFASFSEEQIAQIKEQSADVYKNIELTYFIKGGYIIKALASGTINSDKLNQSESIGDINFNADVIYGTDPFKNGEFAFLMNLTPNNQSNLVSINFLTKNENDNYIIDFKMRDNDDNGSSALVTLDKKTNEYVMTYYEQDEIFRLNGKVEKIDKGYSLLVTSFTDSATQQATPLSISLSSTTDNKIDMPEKFTNILDLGEDEIYSIVWSAIAKYYKLSSAA